MSEHGTNQFSELRDILKENADLIGAVSDFGATQPGGTDRAPQGGTGGVGQVAGETGLPPGVPTSRPDWWPPEAAYPPMTAGTKISTDFGLTQQIIDRKFDFKAFNEAVENFAPAEWKEQFQAQQSADFDPSAQEKPDLFTDPDTGQTFFRGATGGFQPFNPPSAEESLLSLNQQIDKAIIEGDFQYASALAAIADRPTSQDVFDRALAFAKSSGDSFILNQIQRGLQSTTATPGDLRRLPKNSFLTQAFLDLTADPFEQARLVTPENRPAPVAAQQAQTTTPTAEQAVPAVQAAREDPLAGRSELQNTGFEEGGAFPQPGTGEGTGPSLFGLGAPGGDPSAEGGVSFPSAGPQPAVPIGDFSTGFAQGLQRGGLPVSGQQVQEFGQGARQGLTQGGLGLLFPGDPGETRPGQFPETAPQGLPSNLLNILSNPKQAALLRSGAGQDGQGRSELQDTGFEEGGAFPGGGGLSAGSQPIGTGIQQAVERFATKNDAALGGGELQTLGSLFGDGIQLSRGIEDLIAGKEVQRQKQVLPALGFRTPNISNFNRLTLREQSEFMALAQLAGLTPEEVQREIRSVSPGAFGQQGTVGLRSR